jgi:hypothetical protein
MMMTVMKMVMMTIIITITIKTIHSVIYELFKASLHHNYI